MKTLALAVLLFAATPALANITAIPSFIRFNDTVVGRRSFPEQVTIMNYGPQDVSSIIVMPSCGLEFDVNSGTCFGTLRANQSCYMNVAFTPMREGYQSCSITISAQSSSAMISVSGRGVKRKNPLVRPVPTRK